MNQKGGKAPCIGSLDAPPSGCSIGSSNSFRCEYQDRRGADSPPLLDVDTRRHKSYELWRYSHGRSRRSTSVRVGAAARLPPPASAHCQGRRAPTASIAASGARPTEGSNDFPPNGAFDHFLLNKYVVKHPQVLHSPITQKVSKSMGADPTPQAY